MRYDLDRSPESVFARRQISSPWFSIGLAPTAHDNLKDRQSAERSRPAPGFRTRLRTRAKSFLRAAAGYVESSLFRFGIRDLENALRKAGIRPGEILLVHCSYDAFRAFEGRPSDVVQALQRSVGSAGGILMPTIPFTGTAVDWISERPVVDLRRVPSQMGLVSEVFRRSEAVVRSTHPTHPTAAWGAAVDLVQDHALATTPCGEHSPYFRILERNGRIVLLGAGIGNMTFFHAIEAKLESRLPVSPFTNRTYTIRTVAMDGTEHLICTRLFDPEVSRRRNLAKLQPELVERGMWMRSRVGLLEIDSVKAADALEATTSLIGRGVFPYDDYPVFAGAR